MREGRLSAGGAELEWREWGPEEGLAIVMLHEGLGSAALWREFPAALAEATGRRVMAYSRAGHGRSGPAPGRGPLDHMEREAATLGEVMDAAGIGPCVLFGHSDGASIAAIRAGTSGDHRIRGLVLIAPHFFTEAMGLSQIARAAEGYAEDLRPRMARWHDDPDATFGGWSGVWLDPGFADWDASDVIDHLRVPTLAIQGREDQYGTLAQIEALEARSYAPVETLILDGCRHAPHEERPAEVLEAAAGFVARLERMEAAATA